MKLRHLSINVVVVVLLTILLSYCSSTFSFLIAEQPKIEEHYVLPHSKLTLECKVPRITDCGSNCKKYWNFIRSQDTSPDTIFNRDEYMLADSQQANGHQLNSDQDGTYDLVLNNVSYEAHDGIYSCRHVTAAYSRLYKVVVLISPQAPIIHSPAEPAREGQEYQLNCSSSEGNPVPNITWFRENQILTPSSSLRIDQTTHLDPETKRYTTISSLTWLPSVDDHQAMFKCAVTNRAMGQQQLQAEHKMNVEYAPRITVGNYNPLRVLQGYPVTFGCIVNANPPVRSVNWVRDGEVIETSPNYTIPIVHIRHAGNYSCQADNGIPSLSSMAYPMSGTGSFLSSLFSDSRSSTLVSKNLQLVVHYPPIVQIKSITPLSLKEGDLLSLNCSTEASPAPHRYLWTKPSDPDFSKVSLSPQLEISSVSALDMGEYNCTAYNRLELSGDNPTEKHASGMVSVTVAHKPGNPVLIAGNNGVAEAGTQVNFLCRAKPPGYPQPNYKFFRVNNKRHTMLQDGKKEVYTIENLTNEDEGRYSCRVENDIGSSDSTADLIVKEKPVFLDTPPSKDHRQLGETNYQILIHASGKPLPQVRWFFKSAITGNRVEISSLFLNSNGNNIDEVADGQRKFRIDTHTKEAHQIGKATVHSILYFLQPLEEEDSGVYTIELDNGTSHVEKIEIQVIIDSPPILGVSIPPNSVPFVVSAICFIIIASGLATTVHACCFSKRDKKADNLDSDQNRDSKHHDAQKSNTSTLPTTTNGLTPALQNHLAVSAEQNNLDNMLPANYSHYADVAFFMMDQQQQQQQQQAAAMQQAQLAALQQPQLTPQQMQQPQALLVGQLQTPPPPPPQMSFNQDSLYCYQSTYGTVGRKAGRPTREIIV